MEVVDMGAELILRKNVVSLSKTEQRRFVEAVKALKANTKDAEIAENRYDDFVLVHAKTMSSAAGSDSNTNMRNLAHRGSIFLPWHREFLRRFEQDLRRQVEDTAIPYWDWTDPGTWDWTKKDSPIWNDDFMGGNGDPEDGYVVKSGPLSNWITVEADQHTGNPIGNSRLTRDLGGDPSAKSLPTQSDVYNALRYDFYDSQYWDVRSEGFRNALEGFLHGLGLHNRVHVWVGGSMGINTSPNDPIFFLNHCNVDRIWAIWQAIQVIKQYPDNGTIKDKNDKPIDGLNLNDNMFMGWWKETPTIASVLDHRKLGYMYDR